MEKKFWLKFQIISKVNIKKFKIMGPKIFLKIKVLSKVVIM